MFQKALVPLFLFLSPSLVAHASSYRLVNLGADLKRYVFDYRNSDLATKGDGWKKFEGKYQIYFEEAFCTSLKEGCETSKKENLESFFNQLPGFEEKMWAIFDQADELSQKQFKKFKTAFPDVEENVEIVFMPSLLRFNGRGLIRTNGTYLLIIGADLAAQRNNDLDVLFSHELFHVYHFNKLRNTPTYQTLASSIWFEGFATWMSSRLNPAATSIDVLMNQDLANLCGSKTRVASLAAAFRPYLKLSSSDREYARLQSDWFSSNGDTIPRRRGYCLGFRAIEEIAKTHSIEQMTSLNEKDFSNLLDKALLDLMD